MRSCCSRAQRATIDASRDWQRFNSYSRLYSVDNILLLSVGAKETGQTPIRCINPNPTTARGTAALLQATIFRTTKYFSSSQLNLEVFTNMKVTKNANMSTDDQFSYGTMYRIEELQPVLLRRPIQQRMTTRTCCIIVVVTVIFTILVILLLLALAYWWILHCMLSGNPHPECGQHQLGFWGAR